MATRRYVPAEYIQALPILLFELHTASHRRRKGQAITLMAQLNEEQMPRPFPGNLSRKRDRIGFIKNWRPCLLRAVLSFRASGHLHPSLYYHHYAQSVIALS